jgi:transposase
MKEMMAIYMRKGLAIRKRDFIMDNASIHHRDPVKDYMTGSVVSEKIGLEFLPIYSHFLKPLEEVFGLLKSRLWRARSGAAVTDESKSLLKRNQSQEVLRITNDDVRQYYFHVEHFLKFAEGRTPVFTQQLFEASHNSAEAGFCPMLPESLERLLDSYLPERYTEFTPEAQADVEQAYGCKRLTMTMIDDIAAHHRREGDSGSTVGDELSNGPAESETEYNF